MKNPSIRYFENEKIDFDKMDVVVEADSLKGKDDVVGAKLLKLFNFLSKKIAKEGFIIKKKGWVWEKGKKAYFYFSVPKDADKIKVVEGPSVKFKEHVIQFKNKHKDNFIKNRKVYARDKRKFVKAKEFVKELLKDEYVTERVKSIKLK